MALTAAAGADAARRPAKATPAEILERARTLAAEYRPAEAREQYDEYEKAMRRARKDVPEAVEAERSALVEMENMLERVEAITVVDSLTVDSAAFFSHYRLSPQAGRLVAGSVARLPQSPMAFVPQNNTEILYAEPDSAGRYTIMGADILDDGTLDRPRDLGLDRGGADARYPFLMPDGVTLYYAHNGEGSLGGYDIFITRRSDDGFLQPQNVGMPYNSPYDDYLLAIDEATGAGWWATDRNRIPGRVTIYIFVPSATRVNVDPDSPLLTQLARMSDIALTRPEGFDRAAVLSRIERATAAADDADDHGPAFEIEVGGRIYRSLDDFRDRRARSAMARAINARAAIAAASERLDSLRERYRSGDRSVEVTILNLEQQLDDSRYTYREAVNEAIANETRQE
ncbi:MAG: hypothetical protein NC406_08925 [Bacteroides sp.]|nr:hypothetical protein [Bacteroides sp.]MCM1096135.1 hypothetical protein [Terasakiella sp.]